MNAHFPRTVNIMTALTRFTVTYFTIDSYKILLRYSPTMSDWLDEDKAIKAIPNPEKNRELLHSSFQSLEDC